MKRSLAPSLNPRIPKLPKTSLMREATGKGSNAGKLASSSPSLTATQLKSLHYLVSAASYLSVLQVSTLLKAGLPSLPWN